MKTLYQLLTESECEKVRQRTEVRNCYLSDVTLSELLELATFVFYVDEKASLLQNCLNVMLTLIDREKNESTSQA